MQARSVHAKDADLLGVAEAVLVRAQDAVLAAVAFEVEHGVDHVLEQTRPGDGAVLRDVADQEDGAAGALGELEQAGGAVAHLGDAARERLGLRACERLDRVDDGDARARLVERVEDAVEVGFGEQQDVVAGLQTGRAQFRLGRRLLARDVDDGARPLRERAGHLQQQGRLARAGRAADEDDAARHHASTEQRVELGEAGADPRDRVHRDLAQRRCGRGGARGARARGWAAAGGRRGRRLGERVPGAAGGAASQPAGALVPAVGAEEGGSLFGHSPSL